MSEPSPTLRGQLLRRLLLPLAAIWLLSAGVSFYFTERFSSLAYDRALFDSTRTLAAQIKVVDHRVRVDLSKEADQILRYDDYDTIYYQVKLPDGRVIAGDSVIPAPSAVDLIPPNKPIYQDADIEGNRVRVASLYWPIKGDPQHEKVLVQFAETLVKRRMLVDEILAGIAMPQVLIIALATFAVWYGTWKGLISLNLLREAISNRSLRDLRPISQRNVPMELSPIIRSINELMARLSDAIAAQQRFIADASHQLRTPLAGLQAQAELALRQTTHEDMRHSLHQILIGAERSSHLAKQLLALAKAEPGAAVEEGFEPVNLIGVARDVIEKWVPVALKKNIDLGFEGGDEPLMIRGRRVMLEEMLGNLIDNAIKYTPAGGRITVAAAHPEAPELSVEDNGIGIPPEDRGRVFDRFYRALGTGIDGSGLGLSIAREITLSHNGDIWAEAGTGGQGTRIVVRLPS